MKNGLTPDMTIDGGPSCLFDAVVLLPGQAEMPMLLGMASSINWLRDAFGHLKAIGFNNAAQAMFGKAGLGCGSAGRRLGRQRAPTASSPRRRSIRSGTVTTGEPAPG